ncbi:ABC transporter, membrane protein [Syntrophotalea carbinolica DSM 2380]|uniref:ABC transporter, membrane protein n=1 Tax=Syntrophotalea carbinolica (strain DSM 2380 / NBRC 103641 / GraBd1) TaxID=338963 RepID=Q3A1Z5_SYNC1|nr:FtsX-like permease family protein [Syntrophotalea carbinolica]ABA89612.1 ABC transporter, membrane protein [Syntrophotalea carbinolica DSM 2380]
MLLSLALRNIWRNKRRTLLTLSAMVVSLALLILALGIFSGMLQDMLASATEQYRGHLVISMPGYQQDREMFNGFVPPLGLLEHLESNPDVLGVSPRLRGFGLLSHGNNTYPAELLGIRPGHERQVTNLADHLIMGRYPAPDATNEALLGRGLAQKLGVAMGDELVFVTQAADGSIGNDLLTVAGIFATGDAAHDNSLVLVPLPWLQDVMVLEKHIHELALRIRHPREAQALAHRLAAELPGRLTAMTWGALMPELHEAIASFDASRLIVAVILYLATGLGILNTVYMSVMERTREFGVLMAIGMRHGQIRLMVLTETLLMGLLSLLIGCSLGKLMTLYMQRVGIDLSERLTPITYAGSTILPRLHAVNDAGNYLLPAVLLLIIAVLAGWLPARRAAKLQPADALREE